jgi:hypothetical protein
LPGQKCTSVTRRQVLSMQSAHEVHLLAVFLLPGGTPSRNRPRGAGWAGASGQAGVGRGRGRRGLGRRDWSRLGRHWPGRDRRTLPARSGWRDDRALGVSHREACARLRAPAK